MAVRKINNRWYADFRQNGKRIRKVSPENSKSSALMYERDLLDELKCKEDVKKATGGRYYASYEEFSEDWYNTYVLTNNRPSEQMKKRSVLDKHIIPYFGDMKLDQILERELEEFKGLKQREGYAPKTINNILSIIRKSLDCAHEWRCILFVPKIKWMKVSGKEIITVTQEVENLLLNDYDHPIVNTMIVIALMTGMRKGEIAALRWRDLDFSNNVIHVTGSMNIECERAATKNGRVRDIPMSYEIRKRILDIHDNKMGEPEAFIFDRGDGNPYKREKMDKMLKRVVRSHNIEEHLHWHKFRHTFASNLARRGVNMRILQELMGHSTILMTERYAHVDMSAKQSAIQLLEYENENVGPKVGRKAYEYRYTKTKQTQELALLS